VSPSVIPRRLALSSLLLGLLAFTPADRLLTLGAYALLLLGACGRDWRWPHWPELLFLLLLFPTLLQRGWGLALAIAAKALLTVIGLRAIAHRYSLSTLLGFLARLGVPRDLLSAALVMRQQGVMLQRDSQQLQRAAQLRGLTLRRSPARLVSGALIGGLFLRSLERGERVQRALQLRGSARGLPLPPLEWQTGQRRTLVICTLALLTLQFLPPFLP
jgi:energy-coupling factor transporter transmembrane protein EcfT